MRRTFVKPILAGALLTAMGASFAFRSGEAAVAQTDQDRLVLFEKGSRET